MSFKFQLPNFIKDFAKPKDEYKYSPPPKLTLKQAMREFGPVNLLEKRWLEETKHMSLVIVPESIRQHMINTATGQPTGKIYINLRVAPALIEAFRLIEQRKLQSELKSFDGCLNVRSVRGTVGVLSAHCYGLAIDINAKGNGLGEENPAINPALVKCFTDAGWTWGGAFARKDPMHFSYCWE